jgi:Leucine-rich repeat (LRR) protein
MNAEENNPAAPVPSSQGKGSSGKIAFLLGFVAVVVGAAVALGLFGGGVDQKEAAAKLKALGGIAVFDSGRKYITSVNLQIVKDPAKFAQAVAVLPGLPRLTSLNISNTPVSEEQMATIGTLTQLSALTAKDCRIGDSHVVSLGGLKNLEVLYLVGTDITSESIKSMSNFPKMKILDLSYNEKLTRGFGDLQGMPKLDWLLLNGLKLEDESLGELSQLSSLNRLSLNETVVRPDIKEGLLNAVPGLTID